jgi:amino acid transporter
MDSESEIQNKGEQEPPQSNGQTDKINPAPKIPEPITTNISNRAKVYRPNRANATTNGTTKDVNSTIAARPKEPELQETIDVGSTIAAEPKEVDLQETIVKTISENNSNGNSNSTDSGWTEIKKGLRPGDRYIRLTKPAIGDSAQPNAYDMLNVMGTVAAPPMTSAGRTWQRFKRTLVGKPIPTIDAIHERLNKIQALAVLSSDALSSVAYATEQILLVLAAAVTVPLGMSLPIAGCIVALLIVVALSYRQTIHAYPKGGGSYIVAKENLGTTPGLVAAASLMIDYVLTVAVSISSGVAAVTSAFPALQDFIVPICLGFVAFITISNLRGIRESGLIFTAPTYLFIGSLVILLLLGFLKMIFNIDFGGRVISNSDAMIHATEQLSIFIVLRAFASGCTALTGVEAISDGVPAFKAPESKNASITLSWMAGILVVTFFAITWQANYFQLAPQDAKASGYETILSQLSHRIVGDSWFYYVVQATTTLILVLAANTSFSDFPRLSWFLARDKFLPHLFSHRGDRLAFSTGIVALAFLASILIIVFNGNTDALIPLYSVGVFNSFTLSQAGMVVHWLRKRESGWRWRMIMNGVGATATALVLIITASTKFIDGAWIVVCLIPCIYLMFRGIHSHYERYEGQLTQQKANAEPLNMRNHTMIVPVNGLNQISERTLTYARAMSDQVTAVFVSDDMESIKALRDKWDKKISDISLVTIETPFRNVIGPLLTYIDNIHKRQPDDVITVVVPEFVVAKWWHRLLHNQTAFRLRASLFLRPGIVITTVPYHLMK